MSASQQVAKENSKSNGIAPLATEVVNVGDIVTIAAMGVVRTGPASYVDRDTNGGYWLIEGYDHAAKQPFYWKQRHDGGTLVKVEPARTKAPAVAVVKSSELFPSFESPRQEDKRVKNGTYTLVSHKSGEHRTFKITTVHNANSGLNGKRIMSMLVGPNNEADYIGFAFVNDDNALYTWGRFKGTLTDDLGRCLMAFLLRGTVDAEGAVRLEGVSGHVLFKSACSVCNRPLTCPESIRTGIGPVCAGRN